ncbi:CRTAC1 family protein [Granulicella tundricola]|uniref:ASPIC/UnbV domain protein n=1 Tax=Granulicella tundricola (strain ATCC BAA-1859 / DSM 23138 / MP5ACTX9) TaxID=1198114 RepID=E8X6B2_GRATM|nr:CRTAC1 family protein [Granulicella tundricola]ADW70996.1 ASPIC/UnbV domain protein [Granulicella tundricola MP5ACTX9]
MLLLFLLLAVGVQAQQVYPASAEHPTPAWFVDVAAKAGITVRNVNGSEEHKKYIVEATGSGVAIIDYDRDGWPDIFLVNGTDLGSAGKTAASNHLLHNNHDGTFTDVTAKAGMVSTGWGQGACVGDYDNDGFDDIYVTGYGKGRLFHNLGNGSFKEVAEAAGVAGSGKEWGTGCAFVDYDRDGKLDLVIANYVHFDLAKTPAPGADAGCMWKGSPVMCGPRGLPSAPNILFHNDGGGKFTDVSKAAGIEKTAGHYCFSVTTLDYNEDGWPDIYMACDSTPSILYRNNHDGTFTDVAADVGVAFNEDGREQAGMGATAADYDGDGHLDLFKTNFSDDTATLYKSHGDGTYTDETFAAGLGINSDALGWGAMFADVDNDGYPDLIVVNGHVYPEVDSAKLGAAYREPRFLYWNQGNGKFKDVSKGAGPGMTEPMAGRGLAIADLWNDGRLEAIVNNLSDRPMLLVNEAKNTNHWLGIKLTGTKSNRDGIGGRVVVRGTKRSWVDEVRSGSSYNSSNDLRLHFGLGAEMHVADVTVRWPNGESEVFTVAGVDRMVEFVEGKGKLVQ